MYLKIACFTSLLLVTTGLGQSSGATAGTYAWQVALGTDLLEAALAGDQDAIAQLSMLYQIGYGSGQDEASDFRRLLVAATEGNSNAMLLLGHLYVRGLGTEKNLAKGLEWYLEAARKGQAKSLTIAISTYKSAKIPFEESRLLNVLDLPIYDMRRAQLQDELLLAFARRGSLPGVKEMLRRGVDLYREDVYGSPLKEAIYSGNAELVFWMISQSSGWSDYTKYSALETACLVPESVLCDRMIETWLQNAEARGDYLVEALLGNEIELARQLLRKGVNPERLGPSGRPLIARAAEILDPFLERRTNIENSLLALMIASGVDPNVEDLDGETPLFSAFRAGQASNVQFLLSRGASPGHQNKRGETALFALLRASDPKFLNRLEKPVAQIFDLGVRNNEGNTVLHAAIQSRKTVLARFLLDAYPAGLGIRNAAGETPLDLIHQQLLSLAPDPFDTVSKLRLQANDPDGLNTQLDRWQKRLAWTGSLKANMYTFQSIVEAYAVDWAGDYGANTQTIQQEASSRAYWRDLKNPFSGGIGLSHTLLDGLAALPDQAHAGKVVYAPGPDIDGRISTYWLYGVDDRGNLYQEGGLPFVITNS